MRIEDEKESKNLSECRNKSFKFLEMMKRKGKDVESGKCIQDFYGILGVKDIDRKRIWKQLVRKIMNKKMIGTKQQMLMWC